MVTTQKGTFISNHGLGSVDISSWQHESVDEVHEAHTGLEQLVEAREDVPVMLALFMKHATR